MDKVNPDIKNIRHGRHIILALLFFFYNYTFYMTNSYFGVLVGRFFNEKNSIFHIKLILLAFAAALLLFGIILSIKDISNRYLSRFTGIITLFSVLLMIFLFKTQNTAVFLVSIYMLCFIIGLECVYYYRLMYKAFSYLPHTGMIFATGMSCSIILQYILQIRIGNENLILYSLLLISFIAAFINLSGVTDYLTNTEQDELISSETDQTSNFKTLLASTIIIIILFECIGNFLSYPLLALLYSGKTIAYNSPRLFIILSFALMGYFADKENMKYLSLITFSGVLLGIINPVLMHEDSSMYANTCIYYIVAGIINSYFILIMFKHARGKRFAPLISVSGRIIDSICSFIFVSPVFTDLPLYNIIGIELIAIIIIMLLFTFSGQFSFVDEKTHTVLHISPLDFSNRFGFSDKETEVFLAALSFDGTMSELAKSLFISRSVLYRNLSNICEKTDCNSFQAVKNLYYELPATEVLSAAKKSSDNEAKSPEKSTAVLTNETKKANINTASQNITSQKDNFTATSPQNNNQTSQNLFDKINVFADRYALSDKEKATLSSFLENPDKTQKELADMQGITLRTIQRHLANIKIKTDTKSLVELNKRFYSES